MANIWNERRRKRKASSPKLGTAITRTQLIELLRKHGTSPAGIDKMVSGLPFGDQHLVDVQFDGDQIHMKWIPKKLVSSARNKQKD